RRSRPFRGHMSAHLRVERAAGMVTIQDAGRPGFMHLGIPPGGPLAPSRFRAANAAVGNPPDAPAIEVVGAFAFESDGGDLHVAVDDEAFVLAPGETRAVSSSNDRRVRYVAVRGG